MNLAVVILAAGQGTRMRSRLPKVLQPLAGRPLLDHVIGRARALEPAAIHVVYGHGADAVQAAFAHQDDLLWELQAEQLGTGHAVAQALPGIRDEDVVLVLYGDVPLTAPATLERLIHALEAHALALLTVNLADPTGYGRILRDDAGAVERIVEEKDASPIERRIHEVNTGILAAHAGDLRRWLSAVDADNAQGEYYLTDCVGLAAAEGGTVQALACHHPIEVMGVNDKAQLARLERDWQRQLAHELMDAGATLIDPARLDIRGSVEVGRDVLIEPNVLFEGRVVLGEGVVVGPGCVLRDCTVEDGTRIDAHCVIDQAHIGPECRIGPFARIRPETRLAGHAHVGNFVEIKKSEIGEGSKINHLSYVGDSRVGARVNIGAGTITCNYDGARKHRTVIGDDAFIGSDTQLVAPVTVGRGATIGAGSTITRDAPEDALTLSRAKQLTLKGWQRPSKQDKD
ncbi:MAG TPA: UDP-N-acetylglucosamine diphosphorylase/glucosamine-1-phosphate N-acetyltransferase [Thioalkalivibrio sp.]|nr:UDP-N-acetylglucosamine diphosphorylase/glucosamine-1-phosphate N-acetyltransferase [Thioalkalivibrio sp.]